MKATYEGPACSEKDSYRFLLNDTDVEHPILYDEEIQFVIDSNNNHNKRMCTLLEVILEHFAKKPKRSLGPQSEDYSATIKAYTEMHEKYSRRLSCSGAPTMVRPSETIFYKGIHDNV